MSSATKSSGLVVVLTSIDAAQHKWSWDLAVADPSTASSPIAHAKLLGRGASAATFSLREEVLMFYAPNTWFGIVDDAQFSNTNGAVTVADNIVAFLDGVFATGKIPTDAAQLPKGFRLNPAFVAGLSSPFAAAASPAAVAAGAAAAAPAAVASDLITIKDKLENKYAFTVSISAVNKFKDALEQRIITLPSRYVPPATLDRNTVEGMALLYYHYITDEFWKFSERLGGVKKSDYEDWSAKEVVAHRSKKPFGKGDIIVTAYAGSAYRWLVALTNEDLHNIIKTGAPQNLINLNEKKAVVGKAEGPWTIKADAVADAAAGPAAVNINVTIQPRSAAEPTCFTIPLEASPLPEEEGDIMQPAKAKAIVITKGVEVETLPAGISAYTLPAATSEGPVLQDIPLIKCVHQPEVVTGGEAVLTLEAKEVKATQGFNSGPTFNNYFTASVQMTNAAKKDECVSATKVKMEYKDANGDWVEMQKPQLVVNGGWSNTMEVVEENIDVGEVGAAVIGVKAFVTITGECGNDNAERAKAHKSLPQPLNVRIQLTEVVSGAVHTLEMQQANPPLKFESEPEVRSNWISSSHTEPLNLFAFADDCNAGRRLFAGVYTQKDKGLILRYDGRYLTYSVDDIIGVAYAAAKAGNAEHEITGVGNANAKFTALIDLKASPQPVWYGVRVDMKTPTSSSSSACHVAV